MANLINASILVYLVVLSFGMIHGHPLNPEDVEDLLPETPKTKNDTIAAIVEDAVVQEAVQSIVANGTLSGLVVKKNTVILPADKPDVILSQNEQILTAPLSHLEDIRKNITESAAAIIEKENSEIEKVEEISLAQVIPLDGEIGGDRSEISAAPQIAISQNDFKNSGESLIAESLVLGEEGSTSSGGTDTTDKIEGLLKLEIPAIVESGIRLPEGVLPQNIVLPDVIGDKISEPVLAVFNPDKIASAGAGYGQSVIALVPETGDLSIDSTIVNAEENKIKKISRYGDRIPVTVITSEEFEHPAVKIETRNVPEFENGNKNLIAIFAAVPKDEILYGVDDNEDNDMVAAEDIIFRPLFRYRQQQNDRTRILQDRVYQKSGYNRYRPRDDDYNYYYSKGNSYRNNYKPKYWRDY